MRKTIVLAATVLMFAATVRGADKKEELSDLEGVWEITSAKLDGKDAPEGKWLVRLTIKGSDCAYEYNGARTIEKGKVTFDTAKNPKVIKLARKIDNTVRSWIYERKGETLTVCFNVKGKKPPTEFEAKTGSGNFLAVMKKVK